MPPHVPRHTAAQVALAAFDLEFFGALPPAPPSSGAAGPLAVAAACLPRLTEAANRALAFALAPPAARAAAREALLAAADAEALALSPWAPAPPHQEALAAGPPRTAPLPTSSEQFAATQAAFALIPAGAPGTAWEAGFVHLVTCEPGGGEWQVCLLHAPRLLAALAPPTPLRQTAAATTATSTPRYRAGGAELPPAPAPVAPAEPNRTNSPPHPCRSSQRAYGSACLSRTPSRGRQARAPRHRRYPRLWTISLSLPARPPLPLLLQATPTERSCSRQGRRLTPRPRSRGSSTAPRALGRSCASSLAGAGPSSRRRVRWQLCARRVRHFAFFNPRVLGAHGGAGYTVGALAILWLCCHPGKNPVVCS